MCGIFGIIHGPAVKHNLRSRLNDLMQEAMTVGIVRGNDSAGLLQVTGSGEVKTYRVPYSGAFLEGDIKANSILNNIDVSPITVGHHRAATRGSVCVANTHPFEHYNKETKNTIIGVHNGCINNNRFLEDGISFSVDSDWAYYRIARDGGPKAISELEGAMALAWYETADKKLHLFTNGQRSLYWNYVPDEEVMIFASEHEMMYWLCARNDIELEKTMWTGHEDRIYSFDPKKPRDFSDEKVPQKKKKEEKKSAAENVDLWGWTQDRKFNTAPSRVDISKTFQGEMIKYNSEEVSKWGLHLGDIVEFFPSNDPETTIVYNIVGEVMIEIQDKDNKISVDFVKAIIVGSSQEIYDNVKTMANSPGSECKCRIIGTSTINTKKGPEKCLILAKPVGLVIKGTDRDDEALHDIDLVIPVWGTAKVSKNRFKELAADGCSMCGTTLTEVMAHDNTIIWYGKTPYCVSCAESLEGYSEIPDAPTVANISK